MTTQISFKTSVVVTGWTAVTILQQGAAADWVTVVTTVLVAVETEETVDVAVETDVAVDVKTEVAVDVAVAVLTYMS